MNEIKRHFSLIGSFIISLLFPFFALYSDANIMGKVIDSTSTTPLHGFKVSLMSASNEEVLLETYTDIKGTYLFKSVPSGQYNVRVEVQNYVAVSTHPLAVSVENSTIRANFTLGIPGSIVGQVIDSTTNLPISGANVDVMRGNNIIVSALTDGKGYYHIDGLAPRPYIVRVRMPYFQSSLELGVPISNQEITIDFALQCPPGKLMGRVVNLVTGEPISHATINLFDNGFIIDSVQSNEDGSYLITEISPGTYQIAITAQKHDSTMQKFTLQTNQELELDFALEPFGFVEGQVIHQFTGEPVAGASVGMWQHGELIVSTHTDANGFFRLDGLKDCQIVVQALHFYDMEQSVYIAPKQTSTANFILLWKEPTPPTRVAVKASFKRFAHQVNRIHTIKWRESADLAVVAYRIYRDGKMIAEISAKESFVYKDKWRSGKEKYAVTAVNQFGQESLPTAADRIEE
jgi:hypothetical protein